MSNIRKQPNKFQQHCIENGLTAGMVAEILGISKFTVYSYYRGERLPSRKTCKLMEEKLGVDANEIFKI